MFVLVVFVVGLLLAWCFVLLILWDGFVLLLGVCVLILFDVLV